MIFTISLYATVARETAVALAFIKVNDPALAKFIAEIVCGSSVLITTEDIESL